MKSNQMEREFSRLEVVIKLEMLLNLVYLKAKA